MIVLSDSIQLKIFMMFKVGLDIPLYVKLLIWAELSIISDREAHWIRSQLISDKNGSKQKGSYDSC